MKEMETILGRRETAEEVRREARTARAAVRYLWEAKRVCYRPIVMIVFELALYPEKTYDEALRDWADYEQDENGHHWTASRWHGEICRHLLATEEEAETCVHVWLTKWAKEVREYADGVPA